MIMFTVFKMLKSFCAALDTEPNFYNWLSIDDAEVDMLLKIDGKFFLVKLNASPTLTSMMRAGLWRSGKTIPI